MSTASLLAWKMMRSQQQHPVGAVDIRYAEDIFGDGPYPRKFEDFIGQEQACKQLRVTLLAAQARQAPLPHILLASGTPGIGKTTLAKLTAYYNAKGYVEVGGNVTTKDILPTLRAMQAGDVLFIDEIHQLVATRRVNAEWLLQLLTDGVIVTPSGSVEVPKITVIGATTDAQKLPKTIIDRFLVQPVLEPYTEAEGVRIAKVTADRIGITLEPGRYDQVAAAADYNPRVMSRVLLTMRDLRDSGEDPVSLFTTALSWTGLSEDGLSRVEQDYLMLLLGYGGTASNGTMKAVLGETVLDHSERALIARGYLTITSKGRVLTSLGAERAQELLRTQGGTP